MVNKKQYSPSKIHYSILMLIGILLLLVAVSCRAESTQLAETQATDPEESEVIESPEPAEVEDEEMSEGEPVESDELNQCLVCHTDQQALEDTAKPLVALESESSGEG